jgi:transcriptional regulator with XRE-family HTH domain
MILNMSNPDIFTDWLNSVLIAKGWSQSDLARQANMSPAAIGRVLNGQRSPGVEMCLAIADALGHPPEQVFRRAGLLPTKTADDPELDALADELTHLVEQMPADERGDFMRLLVGMTRLKLKL